MVVRTSWSARQSSGLIPGRADSKLFGLVWTVLPLISLSGESMFVTGISMRPAFSIAEMLGCDSVKSVRTE